MFQHPSLSLVTLESSSWTLKSKFARSAVGSRIRQKLLDFDEESLFFFFLVGAFQIGVVQRC